MAGAGYRITTDATTSKDDTNATTPKGGTNATAPKGGTNVTTPKGGTNTATPKGGTNTTPPKGDTNVTIPNGSMNHSGGAMNSSITIGQMFDFAKAAKDTSKLRDAFQRLKLPDDKLKQGTKLLDDIIKKMENGTASAKELVDFNKAIGDSLKGLDADSLNNISSSFDTAQRSARELAESLDPSLSRSNKKAQETAERLGDAFDLLSDDARKAKEGLVDYAARMPAVQRAMDAFSKMPSIYSALISAVVAGLKRWVQYLVDARQRIEQIKLDNIERSISSIAEQSQVISKLADLEYAKAVRVNEAYTARVKTMRDLANAQLEIAKARELSMVEPGSAAAESIEQRYGMMMEFGAESDAIQNSIIGIKALEDSLAKESERIKTLQEDFEGYRNAMNDARKLHGQYAKEATVSATERVLDTAGFAFAGGVVGAWAKWERDAGKIELAEKNLESAASAMEKAGDAMKSTATSINDTQSSIDDIKQKIDSYTKQLAADLIARDAKINAYSQQGGTAYRSATEGALFRRNEEQWAKNISDAGSLRLANALNERRDELARRADAYKRGGVDEYGNSVRGIDELKKMLDDATDEYKKSSSLIVKNSESLANALKKQAQGVMLSGFEESLVEAHSKVGELGEEISIVSAELKTNAKAYEENRKALVDFEREIIATFKRRYDEGKAEEIAVEDRTYAEREAERSRRMASLGREDRYREGEKKYGEASAAFSAADTALRDEADRKRLEYIDALNKANEGKGEGERLNVLTPEEAAFEKGLTEERKTQLRGMSAMDDERKRTLELDRQRNHSIMESWKSEREQIEREREQDNWQREHDMAREDEAYSRGKGERLGGKIMEESWARRELARGESEYKTANDLLNAWENGTALGLTAKRRAELGLTVAKSGEEDKLTAEDERRLRLMRSEGRGRITENREKLDNILIERADSLANFRIDSSKESNRLTQMGLGGGANGYSWDKDTATNTRLTVKGITEMIKILRNGRSGARLGVGSTWSMK